MANYKQQGEEAKKKFADDTRANTEKQIQEQQTLRDENVAAATENTNREIEKTADAYLDQVRSAGIQRELDLRNIRETRANMGLSRSGLSATEQTAAILSAGNKVGAASRQRQNAVDALNQSLSDYIRGQDTTLRQNTLALNTAADQAIAENDSKVDQAVMDAQAKETAAYWNYQGTLSSQRNESEKDRLSGLESAWKDGRFGTNNNAVYMIAANAGWSMVDALKYMPYIDKLEDGSWASEANTKARYIANNMKLDAVGYATLGQKYNITVSEMNTVLEETNSEVRIPE